MQENLASIALAYLLFMGYVAVTAASYFVIRALIPEKVRNKIENWLYKER